MNNEIEIVIEEPVEIESLEVVLDAVDEECPEFDDNLAEFMTENELQTLAAELMSELDADISSGKDWVDMYVKEITKSLHQTWNALKDIPLYTSPSLKQVVVS